MENHHKADSLNVQTSVWAALHTTANVMQMSRGEKASVISWNFWEFWSTFCVYRGLFSFYHWSSLSHPYSEWFPRPMSSEMRPPSPWAALYGHVSLKGMFHELMDEGELLQLLHGETARLHSICSLTSAEGYSVYIVNWQPTQTQPHTYVHITYWWQLHGQTPTYWDYFYLPPKWLIQELAHSIQIGRSLRIY